MFVVFLFFVVCTSSRGNVNHGENCKDVGLDETGEEPQYLHKDGKEKGYHGKQDGPDLGSAHHVPEESNGKGKGGGDLTHHMKRKHEDRRPDISFQVTDGTFIRNAINGNCHKDRE